MPSDYFRVVEGPIDQTMLKVDASEREVRRVH
jgi:hypothetical protein